MPFLSSRQRLPLLVLAACLGLRAVAAQPAADVPRMPSSGEVIRLTPPTARVISHQPEFYHGWPSLATDGDGTLYLAYSGGREYHVCPFGRVEFMVSRDGGETWSWPRTIADSLTDDRDTGLVVTRGGVLLASFVTSLAYQQHLNDPVRLLGKVYGADLEPALARWRAAELAATPAARTADVGHWLVRSTDRGATWSARYRAPGYNPHGPTPLADGRVFYAVSDGRKSSAWVSGDDGLTWTHLADLPLRAGELHAVEAADGTLVVHLRDKRPTAAGVKHRTIQTDSRDGGRTWSAPRFLADGYPPHLSRLQDGTLLCTYGWRNAPFGIRAKVSRDHGRSWSEEFVLSRDGAGWDIGYPTTVQRPDGELVTVWYEQPAQSHHAQLRQIRWRL